MDEPTTASGGQEIIYAHQQAAFDELVAVGRVRFSFSSACPVRMKTSTLIVAPSGSGKTHLSAAVAAELGVPYLRVCISSWMIMGSSGRGGALTLPRICSFLRSCRDKEGAVIMIDEIERLGNFATNSWNSSIMLEAFQLLDGILPTNLADSESEIPPYAIKEAEHVLRTRTLILAGGAFQDIWDRRSRPTIGFDAPVYEEPLPDLGTLATRLGKEFCNRFRSKIVVMAPLKIEDYSSMLEQAAPKVSPAFQRTFLRLGEARLTEACRLGQGPRFLEELLLDAVLAERAALVNYKKDTYQSPQPSVDCF